VVGDAAIARILHSVLRQEWDNSKQAGTGNWNNLNTREWRQRSEPIHRGGRDDWVEKSRIWETTTEGGTGGGWVLGHSSVHIRIKKEVAQGRSAREMQKRYKGVWGEECTGESQEGAVEKLEAKGRACTEEKHQEKIDGKPAQGGEEVDMPKLGISKWEKKQFNHHAGDL